MRAVELSRLTEVAVGIYEGPRYSPATVGRVRMVLRQLEECGCRTTEDLTTATMVRYCESLRCRGVTNPNTVNGYLSAIAAVCTLAVEEGWLDKPPTWRRVRLPPLEMVKNAPPEYDQLCELLARLGRKRTWPGRRLAALAWTISLTGPRLREALYAPLEDLSLERAQLKIDPKRQPTKRLKTLTSARTLPLPAALVDVLARWVPDAGSTWLFPGVRQRGPWDGGPHGSRPIDALQTAALEVGIAHITWHALRHAYGTFALTEWGVPLWVVQAVMGHASIRTTEHYLHHRRSLAKMAAAMQGITIPRTIR